LNKFITLPIVIILFCSIAYAQSFIEFAAYNKVKLAAGVVENNYLLLTFQPKENINIVFNNTLYIDKFKYQNFYFKFYYNFYSLNNFNFFISPSLSGNYNTGFRYYHLIFSLESVKFFNTIFSSDIIADFTVGKNIYYRIGILYSFSESIKISLRYGLPAFNFPEDNYFAPGIEIIDDNLVVEVLVQIPSNLNNIQYSRFTSSFLFNIF